jgi:hypothetical protein
MGHSYACRSSVTAPCQGAAIPVRRRCRSGLAGRLQLVASVTQEEGRERWISLPR